MSTNPCQICGSTDMNLVDGYFYCVECGTQDMNVRETVVEPTLLADGTFAQIMTKKKFTTVLKDAVEMSGEWHKWHAYNFILAGLTDELIALGAKPTVKMKVLWIWTCYIKKFQIKGEVEKTEFENEYINGANISQEFNPEDSVDTDEMSDLNDSCQSKKRSKARNRKKNKPETFRRDIKIITKGMLLTILYIGLNLDKSDIQLTHLFRFIREGRLSLYSCIKFVPKELSIKLIPHWVNFTRCHNEYTPRVIRAYAMTIFKRLELGVPLVPDLNKIICNYITELCLPEDFKDLVLSLINLMPCDFLQLQTTSLKCFVRVPDYEGVCMSYVLLALKMCFGLDCDYEIKLSNAVDKINSDEDHLKSYKLGMYSEPTERLFSFREWCMFLQFRKMILCKYYLPMAKQFNLPADEFVFMEHLEERKKCKMKLSDDVAMDILNRIPSDDPVVIPKKEFPATLTPMTVYAKVILEYIPDPDLKLRPCEDFTQYSLKYVIKDLKFPGYACYENLVQGVGKANKIINSCIIGTLTSKTGDTTMVLVRNCENKNWLQTKPPTIKHVTVVNTQKSSSDKESDHGYDSSIELTQIETEETELEKLSIENCNEKEISSNIEEEEEDISIFDDDFKNLEILEDDKKEATGLEIHSFQFQNQTSCNLYDSKFDIHDTFSETSALAQPVYDPRTFDGKKIIQDLIEIACKKYRIPFPKENEREARQTVKRKNFDNSEAGQSHPKKGRSDSEKIPSDRAIVIKNLMNAYYENIDNDVLIKISEHVKSVIQMADDQRSVENMNFVNDTANHNDLETELQNSYYANESQLNMDNEQDSLVHNNSVQSTTLNGSIRDDCDSVQNLFSKTDPKFDAETHDIKQLYVKFNEGSHIKYILDIESDPEVDAIIDKKISESVDNNTKDEEMKQTKNQGESSDSEDELPLSDLLEEKLYYEMKKNKVKLPRLIENPRIKHFGYWMKHYKSKAFTRSLDMNQKFNLELAENCPISFVFVIRECATILNCTTFCLYKCMQSLEERLLGYLRK